MSNKHMKDRTFNIGKVLIIFLLLVSLVAIGVIIYVKVCEQREEKRVSQTQTMLEQQVDMPLQTIQKDELSTLPIVEVDMPEKKGNYNILGEIEIPKINLKMYILDETTEESLNLSLTKFWGGQIHEAGNFSIIGHNYKGMFRDLKELEIGDTFTIINREGRICTYAVYEIYIVEPDDVSCIEDTLIGQREVTLITCTTGGAKRLILKAKEQK